MLVIQKHECFFHPYKLCIYNNALIYGLLYYLFTHIYLLTHVHSLSLYRYNEIQMESKLRSQELTRSALQTQQLQQAVDRIRTEYQQAVDIVTAEQMNKKNMLTGTTDTGTGTVSGTVVSTTATVEDSRTNLPAVTTLHSHSLTLTTVEELELKLKQIKTQQEELQSQHIQPLRSKYVLSNQHTRTLSTTLDVDINRCKELCLNAKAIMNSLKASSNTIATKSNQLSTQLSQLAVSEAALLGKLDPDIRLIINSNANSDSNSDGSSSNSDDDELMTTSVTATAFVAPPRTTSFATTKAAASTSSSTSLKAVAGSGAFVSVGSAAVFPEKSVLQYKSSQLQQFTDALKLEMDTVRSELVLLDLQTATARTSAVRLKEVIDTHSKTHHNHQQQNQQQQQQQLNRNSIRSDGNISGSGSSNDIATIATASVTTTTATPSISNQPSHLTENMPATENNQNNDNKGDNHDESNCPTCGQSLPFNQTQQRYQELTLEINQFQNKKIILTSLINLKKVSYETCQKLNEVYQSMITLIDRYDEYKIEIIENNKKVSTKEKEYEFNEQQLNSKIENKNNELSTLNQLEKSLLLNISNFESEYKSLVNQESQMRLEIDKRREVEKRNHLREVQLNTTVMMIQERYKTANDSLLQKLGIQ